MTRDEMINELINNDLNDWYDREDQEEYFAYLLRTGFIGYEQQTDQQLTDEMYDRGLLDDTHPSFDPVLKNEV